MSAWEILEGDCLERLRELPSASVDAVVTDPPYGLAFMGKRWDYDVPSVAIWEECLRVLKPGGHLLAFAGTRTQHRMAVRIEDAGFEIRDVIAWVYGSGFPKSHNLDGAWKGWGTALKPSIETVTLATKPFTVEQERDTILSNLITLEARLWLLSPASTVEESFESSRREFAAACATARWTAADATNTRAALCGQMDTSRFESATASSLSIASSWRRTLEDAWSDGSTFTTGTASSTTIEWRTLRFSLSQITPESIILACSLPGGFSENASTAERHFNASLSLLQSIRTLSATEPAISQERTSCLGGAVKPNLDPIVLARKPLCGTVAANVLEHGTGALNVEACRVGSEGGTTKGSRPIGNGKGIYGAGLHGACDIVSLDAGRWPANLIHDGSEDVERLTGSAARFFYCAKASRSERGEGNSHPTVKPVALMRYLCRLVTPLGGLVLDPFAGSGTTGVAAIEAGFRFLGIEREPQYVEIARRRCAHAAETRQPELFDGVVA